MIHENCGGEIYFADTYRRCQNCRAFQCYPYHDPFPTGTNKSKNFAAWYNNSTLRSPEVDDRDLYESLYELPVSW